MVITGPGKGGTAAGSAHRVSKSVSTTGLNAVGIELCRSGLWHAHLIYVKEMEG